MKATQKITTEILPEQSLNQLKLLLEQVKLPTEDLFHNKSIFWGAFNDANELIGCVGVENYNPYAFIRSLAVMPMYQGMGVGELLYNEAFDYIKSSQQKAIYLLTNTADKYFARKGFKLIDRLQAPEEISSSSQFLSICPSTASLMRLEF